MVFDLSEQNKLAPISFSQYNDYKKLIVKRNRCKKILNQSYEFFILIKKDLENLKQNKCKEITNLIYLLILYLKVNLA